MNSRLHRGAWAIIIVSLIFVSAALINARPLCPVSAKGDLKVMAIPQEGRVRAPELTGARGWLNTDKPLSLAALKGKVVLLDFWTYGCINCIHIIPDLKKLEAKYANQLVVIGIHSAKFQNEKETENIRRIILRYEIEHPVYNDSEYAVWQSY
ncbi:MAG TPA: thioredoxin-like domain-containing protein, partial [Pyrinomonadaceae bacterium]